MKNKMEFDLKWVCLCGKENTSTLDHLKKVGPSHTGIRCPACREKMMVSIRVEVEEFSKWMSNNPRP
ncbi:hypothetical protein [Bacillus phage BM-P1]|nr:hypothetical protein [Bacillus phage BM-P1]